MSSSPGNSSGKRNSRDRLIDSTLQLISRQGYEATVVKDIARAGLAPMGSFYYHFPGGKEELTAAAMHRGADHVAQAFERALDSCEEVGDALAAVPLMLAEQLEASGWEDGCPIATTALETVGRSEMLQHAAAEAFDKWQSLIVNRLRSGGVPAQEAEELAVSALSLIEGAEMISRVRRSRDPLDHAAQTLHALARRR